MQNASWPFHHPKVLPKTLQARELLVEAIVIPVKGQHIDRGSLPSEASSRVEVRQPSHWVPVTIHGSPGQSWPTS